MGDGGDRRDTTSDRRVTRREAFTRATYGLGGLLLLRAPGAPPARAGVGRADAAATPGTPAEVRPALGGTAPAAPAIATGATRLPGGGQPRAACDGRSGVVVVGADERGGPVSWRSRDGRTWDARSLPGPGGGDAEVWGVAAHGASYVAVGSVLRRRPARVITDRALGHTESGVTFAGTRRRPTVWWTRDGLTWTGRAIDDVDHAHAQLIAVSCNSRGFVAVGSTLDADGVQGDGGLVLTSRDGRTWGAGELVAPAGLPEGSFTGVAAARDRWYATSSDMSGGAVWTSIDGRRWSVLPSSRRQFADMTLQGVGVRGQHVHVAATRLADHATRYFASDDGGRTWRRVRPRGTGATASDGTVNDLTVIGGELVVVGTRGDAPIIEGGIAVGGH